jgi:hypothetical protein
VDKELLSEHIQIERKLFCFELKENTRGQFLRITEDVGGRRDKIIIPSTGLEEVVAVLERFIRASRAADPADGADAQG